MENQSISVCKNSLPIKLILKESWHLVRGIKLPVFLLALTASLVYAGILGGTYLIVKISHAEEIIHHQYFLLTLEIILTCVIWFFLSIVTMLGIRQALGRSVVISDILASFKKNLANYLKLSLLILLFDIFIEPATNALLSGLIIGLPIIKNLVTFLWILFNYYIHISLGVMALALLLDSNMHFSNAILNGFKMTANHFPKIILLILILYIFIILSIIPFLGIGLIWTIPWATTLFGVLFREIFGIKVTH